jgi:hypothetical protein
MKIAKRLSWHAAAIAAALVVTGAANAGDRDGGYRRHDGYSHRGDHRNDHRRVWRDHDRNHYRYHDRGYRHDRYPRNRHYHYSPRGYYGYSNNYYYAPSWPDYGFGVTLRIPL